MSRHRCLTGLLRCQGSRLGEKMSEYHVKISIINRLDRELVLEGKDIAEGKEKSFPERIKPRQTGMYHVYSPNGSFEGVNFSFTLHDDPPEGEIMYGTCTLEADIPLIRDNSSDFVVTGALGQMGYKPVKKRGHNWSCTITIYSKLDEVLADTGLFKEYEWEQIKLLPMLKEEEIHIQEVVPETYVPADTLLGRSVTAEVEKALWHSIEDPDFEDEYGQQHFVKRYFTAAIYRLKKNMSVSIAENQSYSKETMVHHRSSLREEVSSEMILENSLRKDSDILSGELRATYRISNLTEYCKESEETVTERWEYSAVEYDRDVVVWDLDKAVALYRENIRGSVKLIGISDYYMTSTVKTYTVEEVEGTKMENEISIQQRRKYIMELELADMDESPFAGENNVPDANVDASMISVFSDEVDETARADVLNSMLLAQLAADKKYNHSEETDKWYKKYVEVLENLGWVFHNFEFTEYSIQSQGLGVDSFMLDLVRGIATGSMYFVAKAAIEFLKEQGGSRASKIFGSSSHKGKKGNFQMGECRLNDRVLTLSIGCSYFSASDEEENFFALRFSSQDSHIYISTQKSMLNEDTYGQIRQDVINKLGKRAKQYIADLEI